MKKILLGMSVVCALLLLPHVAHAMHITEGILPLKWSIFWFLFILPFVVIGTLRLKKKKRDLPGFLPLVGLVGAAVFVFSCFPIPVVGLNGMATAHPAGTGMSAILLGPFISVVIAGIALFIQALFLAHGGLTTLGANIFSMGVLGSFSGYFAFRLAQKMGLKLFWCGFLAGVISDICTYLGSSIGLGLLVFKEGETFSVAMMHSAKAMLEIFVVFMATSQGPLCIAEGIVVGFALSYVYKVRPGILYNLRVVKEEGEAIPV
ncbi:MAG: energy-coupling factor ABC transporter permease [Candidatus Scalindua sp.]|nr:energy-coupling factor ABC transporter permease [Candidatus Scalindua sp.]